jgi:hypothetical protein
MCPSRRDISDRWLHGTMKLSGKGSDPPYAAWRVETNEGATG